MNANDFREDLKPTRGQLAEIAREWTRLAGELFPETRVGATELLLRLRTTETPVPAPEALAAAPRPANVAESSVDASRAAASRVRVFERSASKP